MRTINPDTLKHDIIHDDVLEPDTKDYLVKMIDGMETVVDVDGIVKQLEKKIFTADLYDHGWNGQTVKNLLCLGDVYEILEGAVKDE